MLSRIKNAGLWAYCSVCAFFTEKQAANMAAYAVIAVVIAAALYGVFSALGGRISGAVNSVLP